MPSKNFIILKQAKLKAYAAFTSCGHLRRTLTFCWEFLILLLRRGDSLAFGEFLILLLRRGDSRRGVTVAFLARILTPFFGGLGDLIILFFLAGGELSLVFLALAAGALVFVALAAGALVFLALAAGELAFVFLALAGGELALLFLAPAAGDSTPRGRRLCRPWLFLRFLMFFGCKSWIA